jgi:hypothetical protein
MMFSEQISKNKRIPAAKLIVFSHLASLASLIIFTIPAFSKPYEVGIPEQWKQYVSIGELTVDCNAFYGVPWEFGLYPVVRLNLPVENLTTEKLYLKINYRTESKIQGYGNSGMGVCYTLSPREKRLIDHIIPIASVTRPIRFKLRISEPLHNLDSSVSSEPKILTIDPFKISLRVAKDIELIKTENEYFEVKEVQLSHSKEQGNLIIFKVRNTTDQNLVSEAYVAVNDPDNIETKGVLARQRGFFSDSSETIPASSVKSMSVSYNIPPVGPKPVLVFELFKQNIQNTITDKHDSHRRDMTLIGYGSFNLNKAAELGQCIIPVYPAVEERAKLTMEKKSEHFLFRYRPDTYAERNMDKAINEREEAYKELRNVLKMNLPEKVTIDFYPDMEAKALGSSTTWTMANTRSNKHICEVYNEEYQCDPHHELAHIFSYHFPGYSSNQGGIVEAFAAYFEPNNMPVDQTKNALKGKLSEGQLDSLADVLLSDSSSEELVILIDFLLKKDVEKFKKFYVRVTQTKNKQDLEKISQQIYGTDLKDLEKQWHEFINKSNKN